MISTRGSDDLNPVYLNVEKEKMYAKIRSRRIPDSNVSTAMTQLYEYLFCFTCSRTVIAYSAQMQISLDAFELPASLDRAKVACGDIYKNQSLVSARLCPNPVVCGFRHPILTNFFEFQSVTTWGPATIQVIIDELIALSPERYKRLIEKSSTLDPEERALISSEIGSIIESKFGFLDVGGHMSLFSEILNTLTNPESFTGKSENK